MRLEPQDIKIEYNCPVCFDLFADELTVPYLTDCGHHLCGKCYARLLDTSKKEDTIPRCPTCNQPDKLNNARPDEHFQRLVNNLKVRCPDYEEWCEWVGDLKDLHDHHNRLCRIPCPFGCREHARSSDMKEHTRHCHNRMISCENCGYYNTLTIVTEKHYPICPKFTPTVVTPSTASPQYLYNQAPIEFIIGDFRGKKKDNEVWLTCFYAYNRGYKFRLKVYPNGIGDGSGSHLSVHVELMRGEYDDELKWPFEGDIQIELFNWKEDKNHHSVILCFNRHDHTVHRVTSQDDITSPTVQFVELSTCLGQPDKFLSHTNLAPTNTKYLVGNFFKLRVSVAVYSVPFFPMTPLWLSGQSSHDDSAPIIAQFTVSEFLKRKEFNNMYFSEPFTTSPQGYKFSMKVFANGYNTGKGNNITISAIIMKGQHDDHLNWPFTGTIVIEVLNWIEDKRHHKQVYSIDPNDKLVRVTEGEYGKDFGFYKFISHASLPFNSSTNTQYLKDDCICVRVRKSRADDDSL